MLIEHGLRTPAELADEIDLLEEPELADMLAEYRAAKRSFWQRLGGLFTLKAQGQNHD